ncbi:MAG: glycosyltransferase family 87 protein [Lacisediminihabitans sp.]
MTVAVDRSQLTNVAFARWTSSRWVLWLGLVVTHAWLSFVNINGHSHPLGDVTLVYLPWMQHGFDSHYWVGIDAPWVYPILALVPMLLAWTFGPDNYAFTWLALVAVLDAVAFGFLIGWRRDVRNTGAAWWWLAFLVLLGPISVARLDTVTVPLAIIAILFVATRPTAAAVLLTVATWIKVWPAAVLLALVITVRARWRVLVSAVVCSAAISCLAVFLGGGPQLLSFVAQQSSRGLQIEAPVSTLWLWQAFAGVRHTRLYYDTSLLTYQVDGDGAREVSALMTPLLAIVVLTIILLAVLALLRRAPAAELFSPLSLALVSAFIAFNKVGSPQYMSWLAVPIICGLVTSRAGHGRSFRMPAGITCALAVLTQLIYPWFYDALLSLDPAVLIVLTARNALIFVLLGWAVFALCTAYRRVEVGRSGNVFGRDRLESFTHTTDEG